MEVKEKYVLFDSRVRRDRESKRVNYLTEKVELTFELEKAYKVDMPKSNVVYDKVVGDYAPMLDLIETLLSGGLEIKRKGIKPNFHPYKGQQIDLSNIPTMYYCDNEVLEVVFPPTGFDFMTKKYRDTTAFNTSEGYLIRDKPAHIVNFVQDYNVCDEESVVFYIRTSEDTFFFEMVSSVY